MPRTSSTLVERLRRSLKPSSSEESGAGELSNPFETRDRIRYEVTAGFLRGNGIEIGAGVFPSRLPDGASANSYDLRNAEELTRLFGRPPGDKVRPLGQVPIDFPGGAPFLIAHNVLEHTPDPIGTLVQWHRSVADDGVVVISFPDKNACPDNRRLEPPFEHLLFDHLLHRDQHAFESKEHILSFSLGWIGEGDSDRSRTADEFAAWAMPQLFERSADIHWHAFTQSLAERTVLAACRFGGRSAELLSKADFTTTPVRTLGDIILVYRLASGSGMNRGFRYSIETELRSARDAVSRAARMLVEPGSIADQPRSNSSEPADQLYPSWIDLEDRPEAVELEPPFERESGLCYVAGGLLTRTPGDTETSGNRSRYRLFEDGVALGPAHALHADIRELGGGRFSHWRNALYFSTSDNSDPNRNRRKYELRPEE